MEMTERQRSVILGGVTCVCGLAIVLTALLVGYVLVKFANFAAPALMPMLLACLVDFHALFASASGLVENIPALMGKVVRLAGEKFPALKDVLAGCVDSAKDGSVDVVGLVGKFGAGGAKAVGGFLRYVSGLQTLALVLAFFLLFVVLQLVDQIVTTKVQGDGTNLSPVTVVFAYIFWGLVFQSFVGVLLAIPLTAFCKVLWDGLRRELPRDVI